MLPFPTSSARVRIGALVGRPLPPLLVAASIAALVTLDPYLSALLPRAWWARLFLEYSPFKLTPVVMAALGLLGAGVWLMTRVGSYRRTFVLAVFIAAQTNGLRVGFLDVFDVVTFLFFLAWLGEQLKTDDPRMVLTGMLFFAAALLIMDLPLIIVQNPVRWVIGFLGLFKVVLLAFVFVNLVLDEALLRLSLRTFMVVAVLSAAVAVIQFALFYFAGITWSFINPLEEGYKPTPIGLVMRSSAFSVTAQHISGFLVLALPFLLFLWSRARRGTGILLGVCVLTVLLGILVTWNYGAFFVAALVLMLFPLLRWRSHALFIVLGYAILGLIAYYTGLIEILYDLSLGDSGVAKGASQREQLALLGFEKLRRNIWVGTGLRDMAIFSGNYWGRPVHNAFLQAMAELGVLGGIVLIAMLVLLATQLFLAGLRAGRRESEVLLAGLLSLLALAALMMSEPMLDHSNTWLLLGLLQSMLLLGGATGGRDDGGGRPLLLPWVRDGSPPSAIPPAGPAGR